MTVAPVTLPPLPLTGGCQCGAVRYRITAAPVTCYTCHCSACRRQSGSAFGMSLQVPDGGVELDGPTARLSATGGSGRPATHTFCTGCGTRITHQIEGRPVIVVKPGTLDDPTWIRPAGHIFTASRAAWVQGAAEGELDYPDVPDMPELHRRWSEMLAAGATEGDPDAR
ncbi:aldehyde-activating protein [Rhodobacterales bacterium HKCCE2091]|nr:aldehyde-activating protein [Rhodobacterales bacterium HKCCE2091]